MFAVKLALAVWYSAAVHYANVLAGLMHCARMLDKHYLLTSSHLGVPVMCCLCQCVPLSVKVEVSETLVPNN